MAGAEQVVIEIIEQDIVLINRPAVNIPVVGVMLGIGRDVIDAQMLHILVDHGAESESGI